MELDFGQPMTLKKEKWLSTISVIFSIRLQSPTAIAGIIFLLLVAFLALLVDFFMHLFMPYSKLDDEGKPCDDNPDLHCKITMIFEEFPLRLSG